MPCDRRCSGGFYQAWPKVSLPLSSTSSSPLPPTLPYLQGKRENHWCSVKSPLLINEYFLSREGKRDRQGGRERERLHPWARAACMAESPRCASQWRMEIHQRRARGRERERWWRGWGGGVHRQEISPGKWIPKHKSHRPPPLHPLKSQSQFIYSSFSALHA